MEVMSKIKHRTLVHIALNAKGERVGILVVACGRLIPFATTGIPLVKHFSECGSKYWFGFAAEPSLSRWKRTKHKLDKAVRFQRVMLVGD